MRKILILLLSVFILIPTTTLGDNTIKIGMTLGLTGKYAAMSDMQMKGYKLWVKQVNDRGGLAGRAVNLEIQDDQSDGKRAAELYSKMIIDQKVDLLFGPYSSSVTNGILPVVKRYGYPLLVGGASSDQLWAQGYENVFGVYTPASRYAVGFLEMLVINDIDGIAIVSADDSFSKSTAEGSFRWAERYGLEVVFKETFPKGNQDLDEIVQKAMNSGARVLIVCGHFQEALNGRQAMSRVGWKPTAFYATVGPVLQKYQDQLEQKAEGTFSSSQWEPNPDLAFPGSREFMEDFKNTYNQVPSYHAATAFAAGTILEQAVRKAGSIDRKRLNEILSTLDTMSVIGRYGVDKTGMQIRQFPVIIQWQKGRKEIIWPTELKTADPLFGRQDND